MERERVYGERRCIWRVKGYMEREGVYGERMGIWREKGYMEREGVYGDQTLICARYLRFFGKKS